MADQDRGRKGKGRATDATEADRPQRSESQSSVATAFQRSASTSSVLRGPDSPEASAPGTSRRSGPSNVMVHRPAKGGPLSPGLSGPSTGISDTLAQGHLLQGSSSKSSQDPTTGEALPTQIVQIQFRRLTPPKLSKSKDSIKYLAQLKRYFDSHEFKLTVGDEAKGLRTLDYTDTDIRFLLVHAVKVVDDCIKAHKTLLTKKGVDKEVVAREVDIVYFDLDDLTETHDVMPYEHLHDAKSEFFEVNQATLPTIAMLGILKNKIKVFDPQRKPGSLGQPRRQEILRNWINGWARVDVRHHPLKLYQHHFTRADINYAAVYAKHVYDEACETYKEMWDAAEKHNLVDTTVTAYGCPSPMELRAREFRPKDLVDFNQLDDEVLMGYEWEPEEPDTNAGKVRKNLRYSIAVFARNTKFIEAWGRDLEYALRDGGGWSSEEGNLDDGGVPV